MTAFSSGDFAFTSTSSSSSPEISTPAVTHLDRHNGEEADDFEEDFVTVNNNEYEAEETENSPGRFTWVEEETKVSLPQSFRKTDQEKVHIRYLPAFGADQLMLVDLSWAGDEVYEKLRNHSEIKKFWKAVTNHRKLGNLNRDKGMYYIGVEGSFDFGDSDFQRAFLTVVDKLLVEYAGKPKNDVFQEVDLTKQEIPASLLFTVFESQQPPHVDVRDKSHKQLTSRAKVSVLPWSGILPLTSGGSKLVYYGPDHPAKLRKIPVLIDIPAMHALLFNCEGVHSGGLLDLNGNGGLRLHFYFPMAKCQLGIGNDKTFFAKNRHDQRYDSFLKRMDGNNFYSEIDESARSYAKDWPMTIYTTSLHWSKNPSSKLRKKDAVAPKSIKIIDEVVWAKDNTDERMAPMPEKKRFSRDCNCEPDSLKSSCCVGDQRCPKFGRNVECMECQPFCQNNRLQKKKWKELFVFDAGLKGRGVMVDEECREGDLITEYVGEAVKKLHVEKLLEQGNKKNMKYIFPLDEVGLHAVYIDACRKGGIARYINHSCEPNCALTRWNVGGTTKIGVVALRYISCGEELSVDYKWKKEEGVQYTVCYCGSANCRGTIESANCRGTIETEDNSMGISD
mmetsp:Transcript_30265/g.64228  ORF Transcript_30265/g.64228 Transcript_30265/m.64228 type:complete len:619 (-) Transcript_30265:124-1980(-)